MSSPENRSFLVPGLGGLSPWGSRSSTPKPTSSASNPGDSSLGNQRGGDHSVSHRHKLSLKKYPPDCPSLNVKWFYAVDVPKRKPQNPGQPVKDTKPPPAPKKFVAFTPHDSRSIEAAYQKVAEEEDAAGPKPAVTQGEGGDLGGKSTKDDPTGPSTNRTTKVAVNEDYLFDVDIESRELAPVYWLGPIYEVRRGTWFYQDGSSMRTCDENLATQLEEGFLKVKPWKYPPSQQTPAQPKSRPTSLKAGETLGILPKKSEEDLKNTKADDVQDGESGQKTGSDSPQPQLQTHRLFGAYMNSVVTYQDPTTAWIVSDDFMSRMSSTVYQRFAGGGHLGGTKVVRGYIDPGVGKTEEEKKQDNKVDSAQDEQKTDMARKRSSGQSTSSSPERSEQVAAKQESETRRQALERDMANFVTSTEGNDQATEEEEARQRDEKEIQDDYVGDGGEQGREIEHLILVTHGIGQRLGLRMESVNFVHDVNMLRKTLKGVYSSSADLQALNAEVEKLPKNCRVQVLPVCWRHLLDFPKQSLKQNRKEQDISDTDSYGEDEEYPSLADITVEGVPAVRSLITDLALDILLYQSAYREHISGIVLRECNHIYKLFMERNPNFSGQVSLIGHSLGSAILFDILCRQKDEGKPPSTAHAHRRERTTSTKETGTKPALDLDFPVDDLFCLGSPIGLFQMLKGRTIAARQSPNAEPSESPLNPDALEDPFSAASGTDPVSAARKAAEKASSGSILPLTVSTPKCRNLFNIFHPTDPIGYRIEPLITPAMSSLKPQLLPYTKRGIFGAPMGQGLTGIGARVGQSVSGLWTSFSSGIASSILNRSLGFTGDDGSGQLPTSASSSSAAASQPGSRLSVGAGTNISAGGVIPGANTTVTSQRDGQPTPGDADDRKLKLARTTSQLMSSDAVSAPTLIDSEIETLYAGFQKRRRSQQSDDHRDLGESPEWQEAEERGRRLRREEGKVRALNGNGRVDYSIQEGVFDISLIASIASHLSYWADEDVSHFMLSQLLSRRKSLTKRKRSRS
ncbi:MAG: hypothetical protein M4579_000362 [Chaenotheca gracillima]|nr:MAG: hypothetical protein M4579_000362 [Chaenotheca gracillima]